MIGFLRSARKDSVRFVWKLRIVDPVKLNGAIAYFVIFARSPNVIIILLRLFGSSLISFFGAEITQLYAKLYVKDIVPWN
jgi:hypothetical protein